MFEDYAAPKLLKTEVVAGTLVLEFDEPIKAESDFKVTVNGQEVTATPSTAVLDYTITATLTDANDIKPGKHEVVVYNARDFVSNNGNGGNKAAIIKTTYEIKQGVAPYVTNVESTDFNSFVVFFSEPVTDARVIVKKGGTEFYNEEVDSSLGTGKFAGSHIATVDLPLSAYTSAGTGGLTHLYDKGDTSVSVSLEVKDFKDTDNLFGNKYLSSLTLKRDAKTPEAISQSRNEITATDLLLITMNRGDSDQPIVIDDESKITVTDKDGVPRTLGAVNVTNNNEVTIQLVDGDGNALIQEDLEKLATFTVNFAAGAIKVATDEVDVLSQEYNVGDFTNELFNKAFTTKVAKSDDFGYKAVEAVQGVARKTPAATGINENIFIVTYKEAMGPSAAKLANYTLDNDPFPAGTTITMDGSNTKVTITVPKETFAKDMKKKLVISDNVLTKLGSHVVGNIATKEVYMSDLLEIQDNTAPVLESAVFVIADGATTTDEIKLTFSEKVEGQAHALNFIVIAHDGTELATTVADVDTARKEATLTIEKEVNPAQTIKVKVVPKADSGEAQVIADANGNLLKEGTIVTVTKK